MQDVIAVYIILFDGKNDVNQQFDAAVGEDGRGIRVMNYTYLLRCADNSLYCGWTNELDRRIKAHNDGKGAKYTKGRRPVHLAYCEIFDTKEEAMRREAAIKKLSRKDKLELVENWNGEMTAGSEADAN